MTSAPSARHAGDAQACRGSARLAAGRGVAVASLLLLALGAASEESPAADPIQRGEAALRAQSLVAEATRERAAGRLQHARELCERALIAHPGDASARDELARIDAIATGRDRREVPGRVGPAPEELKRQVAVADARVARDRAALLAAEGRNAEAAAALEPAIAGLVEVEAQLPPEARDELAALREADVRYRAAADEDGRRGGSEDRQATLEDARGRAATDARAQRSVFDDRLARIRAVYERKHYELALAQARRLVGDYPAEVAAEDLYRVILRDVHEQRRLTITEREIELRKELMARIERSLIPEGIDGMPVYPRDYLARRGGAKGLESVPDIEPWREAILDALAKRVTLEFEDQDGVEALLAVSRQAGVNLVIDPALQAGGARTVTLRASNMRLDNALDWMTRLMDTRWSLSNGAIYVGGSTDAEAVLRVHDVSALVFQSRDHGGKLIAFASSAGNAPALFENLEGAEPVTPEEVVDLLQRSVSPSTWENPAYGITIRGSTLFVSAPPSVHQLVREFIRAQERLASVQVRIDARWLTIEDSYVEEIGVDWGNLGNLSLIPNATSNITRAADGFFRENGTASGAGRLTNQLPATAMFVQPQTTGTGLTLSMAMLRQVELHAVLTAVERSTRGRILASPSLTVLNGVQGSCFFGNQIAYISDYDVVASNLDPKIQVLNIGASLVVKPLVSADRKYVTMEFRPALATAQMFTETLFAPRVITTGNRSFFQPPVAYPLELPNVLIREAATTIQVPDRGCLLVGGFGRITDEETATRIPFLGNIPYAGRFFGKRGRYSDRSKLYLLATVSIITYDELEATL